MSSRTVVGLFNSVSEAELAIEQLLAAGFPRTALHLATSATIQAAHLPSAAEPHIEPMGTGFIRFFTDLFADNENDAAQAHAAAAHADSAVVTVNAASEDEATHVRQLLDQHGAVDAYKQAAPAPAEGSDDDVVDLEGSLGRVRDNEDLDANGLTTH
jgi:hypothetical protein